MERQCRSALPIEWAHRPPSGDLPAVQKRMKEVAARYLRRGTSSRSCRVPPRSGAARPCPLVARPTRDYPQRLCHQIPRRCRGEHCERSQLRRVPTLLQRQITVNSGVSWHASPKMRILMEFGRIQPVMRYCFPACHVMATAQRGGTIPAVGARNYQNGGIARRAIRRCLPTLQPPGSANRRRMLS